MVKVKIAFLSLMLLIIGCQKKKKLGIYTGTETKLHLIIGDTIENSSYSQSFNIEQFNKGYKVTNNSTLQEWVCTNADLKDNLYEEYGDGEYSFN